jgi:hypothetical protein
MRPTEVAGVPKLAVALTRAMQLGCIVAPIKATGEVRVICPCGRKRVTINARKKDAPVALLVLLKHAVTEADGPGAF